MSDLALLNETLDQILQGIERIERRSVGIGTSDDFLNDDNGLDRLDAIGMMLIVIGESLKNFEKAGGKYLFDRHPEIEWKRVKGVRDFLSHHYFDLDAEVIFSICATKIGPLKQAIKKIKAEIVEQSTGMNQE